jgi:hypothetical protein
VDGLSPVDRIRAASEGNATPISNAVIVLAVIIAISALTWIGKVNGDAAISIFSAIVGALLLRQGAAIGSKASDPPAE